MRKKICWGLLIINYICMFVIPASDALSTAGIRTLCLTLSLLLFMIGELLPSITICLLHMVLFYFCKAAPSPPAAFSGFTNPVIFFLIAAFVISSAVTEIPLSKRILVMLLKLFGRSTKTIIFALMCSCAIISAFVSNVPTCALFCTIGCTFLDVYDNEEDKRRTGRPLCICMILAANIGGLITMVGSTVTLTIISILEQQTGFTITFVQWLAVGIPIAIVMLPLAWLIICKVYKPVNVNEDMVKSYIEKVDKELPKKWNYQERLTVAVIIIMLVLWVSSSWIKFLNWSAVGIAGAVILLLPKFGVIEIKKFLSTQMGWEAFFITGTVLTLSDLCGNNGVSAFLVNNVFPTANYTLLSLLLVIGVFIFICQFVVPNPGAIGSVFAIPLMTLGMANNVSPVAIAAAIAVFVANLCCLFPMDPVQLMAYGKGYYKFGEQWKATIGVIGVYLVGTVLWLSVIIPLLGL